MDVRELIAACQQGLSAWRDEGEPALINKGQLAQMLGVSERSLTDWQSKGMPAEKLGAVRTGNEYSLTAVIEWLLTRAISAGMESAKDRLDRLRGDQLEREMLKEDGVLVSPDDLDAEYAAMVDAARAELLFNMPDALAAELTAILGEEVDVSIIRRHVDGALTTLSHYDPSDDTEGDDGESDAELPEEAEA
ncbi:terminase small subunit [Halomonas cerina]|uniref:Phage terminase Nu1 subunit (DNA packaging protein) n=1 Tax=Halomonas cerina TaxID=447424 RepID=A0A839VFC5_9GAMM|nr:terminase small subunit [Halomonas cerina]MBB3192059.1 phage terminase Nu1 subunit (DNA packaging protein) [Halomonas cerina]